MFIYRFIYRNKAFSKIIYRKYFFLQVKVTKRKEYYKNYQVFMKVKVMLFFVYSRNDTICFSIRCILERLEELNCEVKDYSQYLDGKQWTKYCWCCIWFSCCCCCFALCMQTTRAQAIILNRRDFKNWFLDER